MNLRILNGLCLVGALIFGTAPLTSFGAHYYYGGAKIPSANGEYRANVVVLSGEGWSARSVLPEDKDFVLSMIEGLDHSDNLNSKMSVVYLAKSYLGLAEKWLTRNFLRVFDSTAYSPYQWLRFRTQNGNEGTIIVERMPRAVTHYPQQDKILQFFEHLGTLQFSEDRSEELGIEWRRRGPYQTVEDHAVIQFRILSDLTTGPMLGRTRTDMLSTLASFFKTMSCKGHRAPHYPTDTAEHCPSVALCFTDQSDCADFATAGYQTEQSPAFSEFYPTKDELGGIDMRSGPCTVHFKGFHSSSCNRLTERTRLLDLIGGALDVLESDAPRTW